MSVHPRAIALVSAAAAVALLSGVQPAAAQKAQYSSKDIIDTFANKPVVQGAQGGACEQKGMVTGDDGVCEPVKNSRGFSLPTRANLHSPAATAPATPRAQPVAASRAPSAGRPRQVASVAPHRAPEAAAPHRNLLISFKVGSSELTDQAKANAKVFAEAMASPALKDAKFDVSGYTDVSGDAAKNMALSQSRADSVKSFLVAQGIAADRLEAHGHGSADLAVPSAPTSPKNRRVEARRLD